MERYKCKCSFYIKNDNGNLNKKISCGSIWEKEDEPASKKWFFLSKKEEMNKPIILNRIWKMKTSSKKSSAKITKAQLEKFFKKI